MTFTFVSWWDGADSNSDSADKAEPLICKPSSIAASLEPNIAEHLSWEVKRRSRSELQGTIPGGDPWRFMLIQASVLLWSSM
jgi:hypothetical protein